MAQYVDKSAVVAELEDWRDKIKKGIFSIPLSGSDRAYATFEYEVLGKVIISLDALEVKESDETAEAFARIIRANLTGIDKDVQYKFEQLYKEITGEKMYQGYKD